MPLPPNTTPIPPPIFLLGMSSAPAPTSTPLPGHAKEKKTNGLTTDQDQTGPSTNGVSSLAAPAFAQPRLRLHLNDATDSGTGIFLSSIAPSTLLPSAVSRVQKALYVQPAGDFHVPNTRSVTFIVRPMDGVAYTIGIDLDPEQHKEIHISSRYVAGVAADRRGPEIEGVIVHELVHCYQYNGLGYAPGGLIEGVADWVRLGAGLAPPHWKRGEEVNGKWDAGYQHTAFFLQYLEERFGDGTVRRLNEGLRGVKYEETSFWTGILGKTVDQLWEDYKKLLTQG
ncbi:putative pbsp domain-containing protein [Rosellinia necatrix]|uniref:Putative pbsp domain-containing protein n=1 Tax=Rosellinia necatrix TaxID=77044 RepID=A0A1S7UI84_ROSNE|nr:putative pbsp domain-containing protein [Rosellinia necatrix]